MKDGLYEKILDSKSKEKLKSKACIDIRNVDKSELSNVISITYQKIIRETLSQISDPKDKMELIRKLNETIGIDGFDYSDKGYKELLTVHHDENSFNTLKSFRPKTSIANSTLFTGNSATTLESELSREIRTADRVDFLVSFIKFSGLRLIFEDLVEFTKKGTLRVITTSYMGASDYKAILELSKLPNTEVKISYDTKRTRLHAKAYYFHRNTGFSTAYIGSSNLSNPALSSGLEWNLKVSEYTSKDVIDSFIKTFETYWNDEEFRTFSPIDQDDQSLLKASLTMPERKESMPIFFQLKPYSHQKEILEDLKVEREEFGSYRNLVVAATGTGKTMVAAFDYKEQSNNGKKKLLFLAHRKEILDQSLYTFRNVLRDQNFGELWVDGSVPNDYNHVFASIQTLNSNEKYKRFSEDHFDYIVIDETHHASATSYFRILDYFKPEILIGLTATPERMDGQNILEHFNNRIASEIRLPDAINRKLLSPFHYFAATDPVDLSHLTWARGGYEISQLENVYTKDKQRVQVILDTMNKYLKDMKTFKALGFCVSIKHADFMADSFEKAGIPSRSLHSKTSEDARELAKSELQKGIINCIFTVDLFNEGVDIPEVDTVLFLRPTESLTIFLQQLGRGLRLSEKKEVLTVLDFVGQAHANYDFSFKLRALTGKTNRSIKEEILDEFPNMPAGCHIKLEKIARDYILKNIQSSIFNINDLRRMMRNFQHNFSCELNLKNFLDNYGIEKDRFYSRYSFYELLVQTGNKNDYKVKHKKELSQALRRFARIDSKRLLSFAKTILAEDIDCSLLSQKEQLMLGMIHYTLWGEKPEISYEESLRDLKKHNEDIVNELLDLIEYNKGKIKNIEIAYEDEEIPLDIYASYTADQILVAFGKNTESHKFPMRQGMPLLRYRTRDLSSLNYDSCDCGRTSVRMAKIFGRSDDMLIIRGVNVFPSQVESILLEIDEAKPHYMLIVDRKGTMDTLEIQVEIDDQYFSDEMAQLNNIRNKIKKKVEETLGISVIISLVEHKTLARSEGKAKRVIDKRTI
jgi:superfamily II DNA or RNA helicase/HKD family nuclease